MALGGLVTMGLYTEGADGGGREGEPDGWRGPTGAEGGRGQPRGVGPVSAACDLRKPSVSHRVRYCSLLQLKDTEGGPERDRGDGLGRGWWRRVAEVGVEGGIDLDLRVNHEGGG